MTDDPSDRPSPAAGVSFHGPGRLLAALLVASALGLTSCTGDSSVRGGAADGFTGELPGGTDPGQRVESGERYESHAWMNLAQHQYLQAIRLAPDQARGYESLARVLGRIQAYPAAWQVVARARERGLALDAELLRKLDEASGWPVSAGGPPTPPPALLIETEERVRELAGISLEGDLPRERLADQLERAAAAQDRLIQLGPLIVPRLTAALRAAEGDPYQRLALVLVLLRTELALRTIGEAPNEARVREAAEGALAVDPAVWWHPLWETATLFARLGDPAGHPVIARVMAIDGGRLTGPYAGRENWDFQQVFAVGPLGERAVQVLEPLLRGDDPVARAGALRTLAVLFHENLRPALREVAGLDWPPEFRLMIGLFHLQFLDEGALDDLRKVLDHAAATEAHRMAAVSALAELGTDEARALLKTLAQAGGSTVDRHAQQVLADLEAGKLAPTEPAGPQMTATQAEQALRELIVEYGVGTARLQDGFLRSCTARHLPLLYELRGRILWRVTSEALVDLKAANEVIRRVLRRK